MLLWSITIIFLFKSPERISVGKNNFFFLLFYCRFLHFFSQNIKSYYCFIFFFRLYIWYFLITFSTFCLLFDDETVLKHHLLSKRDAYDDSLHRVQFDWMLTVNLFYWNISFHLLLEWFIQYLALRTFLDALLCLLLAYQHLFHYKYSFRKQSSWFISQFSNNIIWISTKN